MLLLYYFNIDLDFYVSSMKISYFLKRYFWHGINLSLCFLWHNAVSSMIDAGTQTCWLEIQLCPWWTFSNTLSSLFRFPEDLDTLLTQSNFLLFRANLVSLKLHHMKYPRKKSLLGKMCREYRFIMLVRELLSVGWL